MCARRLTGRQPSICFVALNAYHVVSCRADANHVGGAEVQQLQIAHWLTQRGYSVSFVTLDHDQSDGLEHDGIRVFKTYEKERGIPGFRFFHPRWSGLWRAMARADADVYYQRTAECETGQVALWCRLHQRKFIFAAANDSDCDSSLYALTPWREKALYRLGLRLADAVTAQTATQQAMLRKNMGVEAVLVRNCGNMGVEAVLVRNCGPSGGTRPSSGLKSVDFGGGLRILWAGRISEQKRLEWLLDVAKRCPDITFEAVGAPNEESSYSSSVMARAAGIHNVKMCGRVPHARMAEYYQRSHVLCCTSAYEGFPNTFLEAWSIGLPVVSTFDPDGVIAANGLGWVAQDVDGIVDCLRKIAQSPEGWVQAAQAARQYYLTNHTPEVCLPAFERLLLRVAGCGTKPV